MRCVVLGKIWSVVKGKMEEKLCFKDLNPPAGERWN